MIRSTVYNILAWVVLIGGLVLGIVIGGVVGNVLNTAGQSHDIYTVYFTAMLITWFITIIIAVALFYLAASLYHLEQIDDKTSEMLKIFKSYHVLNADECQKIL
ncbi:hypothetical protein [Acetanaerobacterium elongatum]|uniref:Uncharacterized protein n=1 Tax=Acetanaerobacterium elongatum TaxID=258515 RepID=A0A1G9Z392_9FIRM|nr:hypothetical protein [Acetanaerobacterium elongatum]SDN15385.1 hypothetical protein SAMN05192585_11265 [Acetanaerobacterium elongatum]